MHQLIIGEWMKLKRYSILWMGVLSVLFSVSLAAFQSKGYTMLYEDFNNNVIWNNFSLAFPFTIVLIGGFIINREYTDRTLKSILTIPVSIPKFLTGKLIVIGMVTILFGFFSFLCTFLIGWIFKFQGISFSLLIKSLVQIVGMSLFNYFAVMPIIVYFSQRPNGFFAGVGLAFVYGFCGIFVAGRNLTDFYPITAGLGMIGFTGDGGTGRLDYNTTLGMSVLILMFVISVVMILRLRGQSSHHNAN